MDPYFTAALFTIVKIWKQSNCPSIKWIKKMWSIYTTCLFFLIYLFYLEVNYNIVIFAIHWHESAMCTCIPPSWNPLLPPPHPIPLGCPHPPALSALIHALNLDWSSIPHMVIYMFQCDSLKSSHPHLLPQSPKDCFFMSVSLLLPLGSSSPSF